LNKLIEITSSIQQGQADLLPQFKEEATEAFRKILIGVDAGDSAEFTSGLISLSSGTIATEYPTCKACGRATGVLVGDLCSECYDNQNPTP